MKNQKGLTLIEILLATGLASVVFVIISSFLLTLFNANLKSKKSESMQQAKNDLFVELSNSVRWADPTTMNIDATNNVLTVGTATYRLNNKAVEKSGVPLTPKSVQITSFEIRKATTVPEHPGVEITIGMDDVSMGVKSEVLRIFVANRKTNID